MKDALAWIGGTYLVLALLGAFDVGNFRLYYGPDKPPATWCQP